MRKIFVCLFCCFGLGAYADLCERASKLESPKVPLELASWGSTQLGFDLYDKWKKDAGNLFLSPLSISTAFAMTYVGAKGKTAEEMRKVLHYENDTKVFDDGQMTLLAYLSCRKYSAAKLSVANAVWKQKGTAFLPEYQTRVTNVFQGKFEEVDFKNAEKTAKLINDWTSKETHGKIKDLINAGLLTKEMKLVLTNALYFKAAWEDKFSKSQTKPKPFFLTAKKQKKVPMMTNEVNTHAAMHYQEKDFQLLRLAFSGEEQDLVVLLPKAKDGLGAIEKTLTADKFQTWIKSAKPQKVNLTLPKFKMTTSYRLAQTLTSLGLERAFQARVAEFEGIDGGKDMLYIGEAIHKTFLDINEDGAEAAAATAVMMKAGAAPPAPTQPIEFRVDHPFFFAIYDRGTSAILFLGRLSHPE